MAKFKYQARNKSGELQAGFIEAVSQETAANTLLRHDLFILSLISVEKKGFRDRFLTFLNRVRTKDLMVFTRQLATLIESEMPLDNALKTLYQQTKNPILREAVFQVQQDVESGLSLSQALDRQKSVFSDFYVNMVRSAEVTGRLQEAMLFLAGYVEKEAQWKSRIANAMIYPAVLLGLFLVVAIVMVVVVFPKIQPVFEESGVDLPWISQALLSGGNIFVEWWWLVLLILVGLVFIAIDYFKSDEGKIVASQLILVLPVFGELFRKIYIARFSQSLSVLIKGGVPIAQAIEIGANTIGNIVYKEVLDLVATGVREGNLFSQLLSGHEKYFPPMVGQMTAIGETTGRIDEMMLKISDFYDKEVNDMMANLSELIQPILILVIGLFIGLLFASILLPIYNLAQSFKL